MDPESHRLAALFALEPAQLRKGLGWALRQPWLEEGLRALFVEAQSRLAKLPASQEAAQP